MTGNATGTGDRRMMPEVRLPFPDGRVFTLSDLRHRRHAVLLFLGDPAGAALLDALPAWAESLPDFAAEETEVVAVVAGKTVEPRPSGAGSAKARAPGGAAVPPPFPVLEDGDGRAHRAVGTEDGGGNPTAALFVVDRYGEIHHAFRPMDGTALPPPAEILEWVRFIASLCPE